MWALLLQVMCGVSFQVGVTSKCKPPATLGLGHSGELAGNFLSFDELKGCGFQEL